VQPQCSSPSSPSSLNQLGNRNRKTGPGKRATTPTNPQADHAGGHPRCSHRLYQSQPRRIRTVLRQPLVDWGKTKHQTPRCRNVHLAKSRMERNDALPRRGRTNLQHNRQLLSAANPWNYGSTLQSSLGRNMAKRYLDRNKLHILSVASRNKLEQEAGFPSPASFLDGRTILNWQILMQNGTFMTMSYS